MKPAKINDENIVAVLHIAAWILLAISTIAGAVCISFSFALSIASGGILAIGNNYWLKNILQRVLYLQPNRPAAYAVLRYIMRLTILALSLYALIVWFHADIFGLLIGLSVIAVTITISSIYMYSRKGD